MLRGWTIALVTLALAAPALAATRTPRDSWGKPGVSLAQYRADAVTCGSKGYYRDIAGTEPAKAFLRGSRELDAMSQGSFQPLPGQDPIAAASGYAAEMQQIVASVRPEKRMRQLKHLLLEAVDDCLIARGYRRFHLTRGQRDRLAKLPIGAPERHAFLYSLASDPTVLRAQAEWYVEPTR